MAVAPIPSVPRVSLRPASPRDADLLRRWRSEPSVRRYQPLNDLSSSQLRSDVASQRMSDLYRGRGEKFQWIIQSEGEPVGWITLVVSNWDHGLAEVGYALTSAWQGRGVMPVALEALLEDLFSQTTLERIEARCAVDNAASQVVLDKTGFIREGRLRSYFRLRGQRVDNYLYSQLRQDFYARRAGGG
ncbi:MAG TPA: GNAT family protein [Thermoanaerobaculia bacterium]|nr:GNAT family protein [Thermoanaerobaculia bacterium]